MATLLSARNLTKTYGTHTLFTDVALAIHDAERLALIGPNGSGKSTLLKILAGLETPDTGDFTRQKNLRLAYLAQADRFTPGDTALAAVLRRAHHQADGRPVETYHAQRVLSQLGFADHEQPVDAMSGGWRKRLALAAALVTDPDVLMLDEPTNHLDLEGVLWLEDFVNQTTRLAMVFITHDRTFLESTATRIVELSRAYPDGTFEAKGNYSEFLRRKDDFLDAQAQQQSALAGKVRRDTAWLKQGIQGRQTRNKTQVADAAARRDQLASIDARNKAPTQTTTIDFQATDRKTKRLLSLHNVAKTMGGKTLFQHLDLTLGPGQRLGLLGPNGSGKTTLLRLITGDLPPDQGTRKTAAQLRVVNFTQHRDALNPTQKLREALCPVGDTVDFHGKPVHVASWAKKFLFDPAKFNVSVGDLSGGEQARVLIANLMLQPADLLILDEPTNDLDIPSLEVLEQALTEFPGAIVLVTHDRFMLDRLATDLLALDGQGHAKPFASYPQYLKHQKQTTANPKTSDPPEASTTKAPPPAAKPASTHKLTYKLQRELDGMEDAILQAEAKLQDLQTKAADPAVMADHPRHARVCQALGDAQTHVEHLYARWAQLEELAQP